MKKLTKTLSLVLVVAMVLSLCVIGAGATFTDNDKITKDYSEAVTIATDLGVVKGNANGAFNPAGTLTRAEAAVILAKMTVGSTADTLVYTKQTFKDVPTSFWGFKYIEYAAAAGLVAGVGNGNYGPNQTLTGYQWALMVLKALGYTNEAHDISGANWALNTARLYYGVKLSNVAISGSGITREAATQIAYDALFFGTVVGSTKETTMTVNGVTVTTGAKEGTLLRNSTDTTVATAYTDGAYTLARTVFGVTKAAGQNDAFGRPATTYKTATKAQATAYGWNAATFSTKAKSLPAAATLIYTKAVTGLQIYKDLGLSTAVTAVRYVNSATNTDNVAVANSDTGKAAVVGGQGTLTEVYYDAANGTVKIVCVDTYLAKVGVVTKSTTNSYGVVTDPSTALTVYVSDTTGVQKTFSTQAFAQDSYVLVTMADGVVQSVVAAKSATGTMTAYTTSTKTIGGTTYPVAAKYMLNDVATNFTGVYTCYTDTYGNLIGTVTYTPAAATNYLFVISMQDKAASSNLLTSGAAAAVAKVRMIDGTEKTVNLKLTAVTENGVATGAYTYAGWTDNTQPEGANADVWNAKIVCGGKNTTENIVNQWIAYTENTDGTYTLSEINPGYAAVGALSNATKGASNTATLNSATYYMTAATKLVTYDTTTKTTTTYTGYTNFPANTSVGGAYTNVLYTYAYGSKVIDTVYATVTSTAATASYAFVKAQGSTNAKGTEYTVYIDGVKSTVIMASGTLDVGYVYTGMQVNSSNVVTAAGNKINVQVYDPATATYKTGEKVTLAEATYFTTVNAAGDTTTAYTYATSNGAVTAKVYNVSGGEMTAATLAAGNYVVVVDGGTAAAALVMIVG